MTKHDTFWKNGAKYTVIHLKQNGWRCIIQQGKHTASGWGATKKDAIIAAEMDLYDE